MNHYVPEKEYKNTTQSLELDKQMKTRKHSDVTASITTYKNKTMQNSRQKTYNLSYLTLVFLSLHNACHSCNTAV